MKLTDKFEKLPGIYIFTNLKNGKQYVGETVNIRNRMRRHKSGKKQAIHLAIKKYGIENFDVYVEYFPDFSKKDLIELEGQLIIRFNSLAPNGYNLLKEGIDSTGFKHSKESKLKMSEIRKGKPLSEEFKRGSREANLGRKRPYKKRTKPMSEETKKKIGEGTRGKTGHSKNLGRKHTAEAKKNMSIGKKGKMTHKNSMEALGKFSKSKMIPVEQIDLRTLKVIKIWPSIADAAEHIKSRDRGTSIVACLKGKYKSALGFKWEYHKD